AGPRPAREDHDPARRDRLDRAPLSVREVIRQLADLPRLPARAGQLEQALDQVLLGLVIAAREVQLARLAARRPQPGDQLALFDQPIDAGLDSLARQLQEAARIVEQLFGRQRTVAVVLRALERVDDARVDALVTVEIDPERPSDLVGRQKPDAVDL